MVAPVSVPRHATLVERLRGVHLEMVDAVLGGDGLVDGVVEAIAKAARTDKIGDGKVFVLDVESALRIRTGETDEAAL